MIIDIELSQIECCSCGVIIYLPITFKQQLKYTKNIFYCINGHSQSFTKSTADILEEKNKQLQRQIALKESRILELENKPKRRANRTLKLS